MVELDNLDKRRRSSGGKLRGCVSGSNLLRREDEVDDGSVECRESLAWRGVEEDDDDFSGAGSLGSRYDTGRELLLEGDLLLDELFVGDAGSECGCVWCCKKSRSSTLELGVCFLDDEVEVDDCFLLPPKNFIF